MRSPSEPRFLPEKTQPAWHCLPIIGQNTRLSILSGNKAPSISIRSFISSITSSGFLFGLSWSGDPRCLCRHSAHTTLRIFFADRSDAFITSGSEIARRVRYAGTSHHDPPSSLIESNVSTWKSSSGCPGVMAASRPNRCRVFIGIRSVSRFRIRHTRFVTRSHSSGCPSRGKVSIAIHVLPLSWITDAFAA